MLNWTNMDMSDVFEKKNISVSIGVQYSHKRCILSDKNSLSKDAIN